MLVLLFFLWVEIIFPDGNYLLRVQNKWRTFLRCAIYTPFFWERKNTPINGSAPPDLSGLGPSAGIKPLIFARLLEISWLFIFFLASITVSHSGQKKKNRPNQAKSLNRWRNSRLCSVSRPFNLGSRSAMDFLLESTLPCYRCIVLQSLSQLLLFAAYVMLNTICYDTSQWLAKCTKDLLLYRTVHIL